MRDIEVCKRCDYYSYNDRKRDYYIHCNYDYLSIKNDIEKFTRQGIPLGCKFRMEHEITTQNKC